MNKKLVLVLSLVAAMPSVHAFNMQSLRTIFSTVTDRATGLWGHAQSSYTTAAAVARPFAKVGSWISNNPFSATVAGWSSAKLPRVVVPAFVGLALYKSYQPRSLASDADDAAQMVYTKARKKIALYSAGGAAATFALLSSPRLTLTAGLLGGLGYWWHKQRATHACPGGVCVVPGHSHSGNGQ